MPNLEPLTICRRNSAAQATSMKEYGRSPFWVRTLHGRLGASSGAPGTGPRLLAVHMNDPNLAGDRNGDGRAGDHVIQRLHKAQVSRQLQKQNRTLTVGGLEVGNRQVLSQLHRMLATTRLGIWPQFWCLYVTNDVLEAF